MARRSDHSREELREMILAAATEIVRKQGVTGLTVRAVTDAIGYTAGTLYQIYPNLDALIIAVNAQTVSRLRRRIDHGTRASADPPSRLAAMAREYVQFAFAEPNLWRLAFEHEPADAERRPASITNETDAVFAAVRAALRAVAPDRDADTITTTAAALWSGVHGVCHLALTRKLELAGDDSVRGVLDRLVETLLAGLSAPASEAVEITRRP